MKVRKGKAIGSGAKGTVYQAIDETTGNIVALKEIVLVLPSRSSNTSTPQDSPQRSDRGDGAAAASSPSSSRATTTSNTAESAKSPERFYSPDLLAVDNIRNEIELMQKHAQSHPNLIQYLGCNVIEGVLNTITVQIVMEFVPGGSVSQRVRNHGALSESAARSFIRDVLVGLVYLHDTCHVCHRDIKGENLLITTDGQCKICDFGASKALSDSKHLLRTCIGTPFFMAPEVLQGEGYSYSADVWSLGCTLFEMLEGKPPFSEFDNPMAIMYKVCVEENAPSLSSVRSRSVSSDCLDFLAQCFRRDPRQRPSAHQLLHGHPWISPLAPSSSSEDDEAKDDVMAASGAKGGFSIGRGGRKMSMSKRRASLRSTTTEDDDDFFPLANDEKKALKEFFATCQKCKDNVALFSCDKCRKLEYAHQLCAKCWDSVHSHHRVASHRKFPLLVSSPAAATSKGSSKVSPEGSLTESQKMAPTFKKAKDATSVAFPTSVHQETLKGGSVVELFTVEPTEWVCGKCHYDNDALSYECVMCDHPR